MDLTPNQIKAGKCLNQLWENGSFKGNPAHLTVVREETGRDDGAGISYGKSQATENGGSLWPLLYEDYPAEGGRFTEELAPYRSQLYPQGEKDALTENEDFRSLLIQIGKEDPAMSSAQNKLFDRRYWQPAMVICDYFGLKRAFSAAAIYDLVIQNGPGSQEAFEKINPSYEHEDHGHGLDLILKWYKDFYQTMQEEEPNANQAEKEKSFTAYMLNRRDAHLGKSYSRYRTKTMIAMVDRQEEAIWDLDVPLSFVFYRKGFLP